MMRSIMKNTKLGNTLTRPASRILPAVKENTMMRSIMKKTKSRSPLVRPAWRILLVVSLLFTLAHGMNAVAGQERLQQEKIQRFKSQMSDINAENPTMSEFEAIQANDPSLPYMTKQDFVEMTDNLIKSVENHFGGSVGVPAAIERYMRDQLDQMTASLNAINDSPQARLEEELLRKNKKLHGNSDKEKIIDFWRSQLEKGGKWGNVWVKVSFKKGTISHAYSNSGKKWCKVTSSAMTTENLLVIEYAHPNESKRKEGHVHKKEINLKKKWKYVEPM